MRSAPTDPHEPRTVRHLSAFAIMCLMWGSTFLAIRLGNDAVPPMWAATLRLVIAGTILAAIASVRRIPYPRGASLQGAMTFGFLNMGLDLALLYWGETRVSSGTAALFFATLPLMTGLFAWLLHVHALDRVKTLAAVAGLAGVALIFAGEISLGAPPLHLGAVWLAATTVATGALITPVLAVSLGAAVRGEAPAPLTYVGGALVLAGVAATLFVAGRRRSLPASRSR